jgi:hypothetical protein
VQFPKAQPTTPGSQQIGSTFFAPLSKGALLPTLCGPEPNRVRQGTAGREILRGPLYADGITNIDRHQVLAKYERPAVCLPRCRDVFGRLPRKSDPHPQRRP